MDTAQAERLKAAIHMLSFSIKAVQEQVKQHHTACAKELWCLLQAMDFAPESAPNMFAAVDFDHAAPKDAAAQLKDLVFQSDTEVGVDHIAAFFVPQP